MLCYTLYLYPNPFFLYLKSKPLLIGYTLVGLLQPSGIDTFSECFIFWSGWSLWPMHIAQRVEIWLQLLACAMWLQNRSDWTAKTSLDPKVLRWVCHNDWSWVLAYSVEVGGKESGRMQLSCCRQLKKRCKVSNWLVSSKGWISNWIYRADIVMECDWSSCSCHVCDIVIYEWFSEQVLIESKRIN